jgi:hypothetical protein
MPTCLGVALKKIHESSVVLYDVVFPKTEFGATSVAVGDPFWSFLVGLIRFGAGQAHLFPSFVADPISDRAAALFPWRLAAARQRRVFVHA